MSLLAHALGAPDALSGGGAAAYAWAFGQGVLVDLTPCVYPLIPITVAVFGAKGVSRGRALLLATAYVLGMASLYTTLGIVVALTGDAFGAWLGNPWVVGPIALLLVVLATSMFGAFDIQLPTSLQNRLNTVGGAGPVGAFLMGLVSGFVSAPCTGPVLLSLLMYIAQASAQGGSVLYGGSLLFVYALGMGTLFFAVALGAGLLRPGAWMEHVKSVFGIALLVMALWFMRPLSADLRAFILDPDWGIGAGLGMIAVGVGLGAVHLSFHGNAMQRLRKGLGVLLATVGAVVVLNGILYVPPMAWHEVRTIDDLERAVAAAEEENKPILVDFSATWCTPCLEMEVQTFHDERVEPLLATRFTLVKIDVSDPTDDQSRIQDATQSGTLPAVLVYGTDAELSRHIAPLRAGEALPPPAVRFDTFVEADVFLDEIEAVR